MTRSFHRLGAFSLVEVTLALGVTGFCLIAIFGLLPTALQLQSNASEETASIGVASALSSDLRATSGTRSRSARFSIPLGTTTTLFFDGNGSPSPSLTQQSRYRATIEFPSNSGGGTATFATVRISWPAPAEVANAAGSRIAFVAIDRS